MENIISVGGMDYEIVFIDEDLKDDEGNKVFGYCDYGNQQIVICNNLKEDVGRVTVLHEIFHATFEEAGQVGLNEEDTVDYMAHAVHSLLKYNLPLIAELYSVYYDAGEGTTDKSIGFKPTNSAGGK